MTDSDHNVSGTPKDGIYVDGVFSDLLTTIKTDLQQAGDWLEQEAVGGATALWTVLKVAFMLITSKQAQVLIAIYSRIQDDLTAGKSLEQIETDVLQEATADELAVLKDAGSVIVQGILAFLQANKAAKAAALLANKPVG